MYLRRLIRTVGRISFSAIPVLCIWAQVSAASNKPQTWSKEKTTVLRSLWIGSLPPPPPDPSNRYADNPKAQLLGEKIFFDKRFSKNGKVSCGTCHDPNYSFTEEMPRAFGIGPTVRRSQHLIGMAYGSWFFWDGRADSLWAQALGPPENPMEHGVTRTICARIIAEHYRKEYEEVFGPLPDLPRNVCIPLAMPDPADKKAYRAWKAIPPAKANEITRVYANMGKAIAAYVRMILPGSSRFDNYVEALVNGNEERMDRILDGNELEGLRLFIGKAQCINCHKGPLFTNGQFRRTGVYQPSELPPDRGRYDGIQKVLASEFNCLGKYSDASKGDCTKLKNLAATAEDIGAFKVPSLRNVAERAPYVHAGQYWALWEVLRFYGSKKTGRDLSPELFRDGLDDEEQRKIEAFLKTLSAPLKYPQNVPEPNGTGAGGHHHH